VIRINAFAAPGRWATLSDHRSARSGHAFVAIDDWNDATRDPMALAKTLSNAGWQAGPDVSGGNAVAPWGE
jgi:hypothetical protein